MHWYVDVLKKYAEFEGRARRQEYWMFLLINLLIAVALAFVEGLLGSPGIVGMLYSLAVLIPGIAVAARRLHDTGRSGWWLLISLVPLIGGLVLLVFLILPGERGGNLYGPDPIA